MKILITGGAGFLGSNLAEKLLARGEEVIALDNFRTSLHSNVERLKSYDKFSFVEQDVIEPFDIECDQIYNLACPASPPLYQIDPLYTAATSYHGAMNALALAKVVTILLCSIREPAILESIAFLCALFLPRALTLFPCLIFFKFRKF